MTIIEKNCLEKKFHWIYSIYGLIMSISSYMMLLFDTKYSKALYISIGFGIGVVISSFITYIKIRNIVNGKID